MPGVYRPVGLSLNGTLIPFSTVMLDPEVQPIAESTGLSIAPQYIAAGMAGGKVSFSTPALATLLTALSSGLALKVSASECKIHFGLMDGPALASGSVHRTVTVGEGLIYLTNISAQQDQFASADVEIQAIMDGSNAPWITAGSAALPSATTLAEGYTLGPVVIGGTRYDTTSIRFATNFDIKRETLSGNVYPSYVAAIGKRPEAEVGLRDLASVAAYPLPVAASDTAIYFTETVQGGGRTAIATATHTSITFPSAMIRQNQFGGSHSAVSDCGITIHPVDDPSNGIGTIDTTAALPALS